MSSVLHRLSFVFLGLFSGCAHYVSRPLSPADSADSFEARNLDDPALGKFLALNEPDLPSGWPLKMWDLQELAWAAFYFQPSLAVARSDWQVARAGAKTAAGRPNPSVSVGTGYDRGIRDNFSPWLPSVAFDIPIETAGKRGRRVDQANALSESARLSIATAAWAVRSEVRASLVELVAAEQRERLLQNQVGLERDLNDRLRRQLEAGAIATSEAVTQRAAAAKAAADLADSRRQAAQGRVRLAQAIGLPVSALKLTAFQFDLLEIPPSDRLVSESVRRMALRNRADILGALAEYIAAQDALRLEIARQYPDIHLGPGYTWNQGNQGDSEWQLGLTVELPLLNRNQGPIAEAEARRVAAAARFVAVQAKAIGEIDHALAGYATGRANVDALRLAVAAAKSERDSAAAQVNAGAVDQLGLLGAEAGLNAAKLAELDAEVALQLAFGALESAVQQPMEPIPASAPPFTDHS